MNITEYLLKLLNQILDWFLKLININQLLLQLLFDLIFDSFCQHLNTFIHCSTLFHFQTIFIIHIQSSVYILKLYLLVLIQLFNIILSHSLMNIYFTLHILSKWTFSKEYLVQCDLWLFIKLLFQVLQVFIVLWNLLDHDSKQI